MGLNLFSKSCSNPYAVTNSNPDPKRFKILQKTRIGRNG